MRKAPKNVQEFILRNAEVLDIKVELSRDSLPITTIVLQSQDYANAEQFERMKKHKEPVYLVFKDAIFEDFEEEKKPQ